MAAEITPTLTSFSLINPADKRAIAPRDYFKPKAQEDALLGTSDAPAATNTPPAKPVEEKSATDEFLNYMNKTPAQRMREQILNSLGYTEESLAALPPEERQKVEMKIAYIMEETLKKKVQNNTAGKAQEAKITSEVKLTPPAKDALLKLQEVPQAESIFTNHEKKEAA